MKLKFLLFLIAVVSSLTANADIDTVLKNKALKGDTESQVKLADAYYTEGNDSNYAEAFKWYRKAAAKGNAYACVRLFYMYNRGRGVAKDDSKAMSYLHQALEKGDGEAFRALASCYEEGLAGTEVDTLKAIENYIKSTEKGVYKSFNDLGLLYISRGEKSKGLECWQKGVDNGVESCSLNLGYTYFWGENGVEKDYAKSLEYWQPLANKGDAEALKLIGNIYWELEETDEALSYYQKSINKDPSETESLIRMACIYADKGDYAKAFEYFNSGVELKDSFAEYMLGMNYYYGKMGTNCDHKKGVELLERSAAQNNGAAYLELGKIYYDDESDFTDYHKAFSYLSKAVDKGEIEAPYELGKCYLNGRGCPKNYEKAISLYKQSAEAGVEKAQFELARVLGNNGDKINGLYWLKKLADAGNPVGQSEYGIILYNDNNYKEGVKWLQLGANAGYARAQYCLGVCYENGTGVKRDYSKAKYWYEKAANQGVPEAMNNLGTLYSRGNGVPHNENIARDWWRKAAAAGDETAKANLYNSY